jgi:hypothetical protein
LSTLLLVLKSLSFRLRFQRSQLRGRKLSSRGRMLTLLTVLIAKRARKMEMWRERSLRL